MSDPAQILPSPLGDGVPGLPGYPGHPGPDEHEHHAFTGKIDGIIYDTFGDFVAFILKTREGDDTVSKATKRGSTQSCSTPRKHVP